MNISMGYFALYLSLNFCFHRDFVSKIDFNQKIIAP